jgi:hypothetical protein
VTYIRWEPVLRHAAGIVDSYDTGVTLRQLFYRLIADGTLPNTSDYYTTLSRRSAEARREGVFPDLIDQTRNLLMYETYDSPTDALADLHRTYRRDRTEGQEWSVYLGVEKHGMAAQLMSWFGDLGIPILTLGGWSSQTFADDVAEDIVARDRDAVLLYAGDFDPSGWFIPDDFVRRVGEFTEAERIALHPSQIEALGLVENPAPAKSKRDSRASAFRELFGTVRQVEIDAIDPPVLHQLYADALAPYWDDDPYQDALALEQSDRDELDPRERELS